MIKNSPSQASPWGELKKAVTSRLAAGMVGLVAIGATALMTRAGDSLRSTRDSIVREAADSAVRRMHRDFDPTQDASRNQLQAAAVRSARTEAKVDALIGVMTEAFPAFRRAAAARAQRRMDSREVRQALEGDSTQEGAIQ